MDGSKTLSIPGNVFPRKLTGTLTKAVKAEGVYIYGSDGKRYLDASGGPVLVNVGHGRREIADAVHKQILQCDYVHGTMFQAPVVEKLAGKLAEYTPEGIDRFYFLSGGGEAVETAIKLARTIHLECGRPQKYRLISRWKSYHGLTMGALAATGRTSFKTPYVLMLTDAIHIPAPYCLRCSYGLKYPGCKLRCALALEEVIQNVGHETVSAFLAETVSGATLASCPPPEDYFTIIRDICDHYNVLLILDEVMCGLGRTGRWFAAEHFNVSPDIMTLGKGLAGGSAALSAVGAQSKHFEKIVNGSAQFVHGGTFSHHNVAAAASLEVLSILEREHLIERAEKIGGLINKKLKERFENHKHVGDIRGIGCMWGIEIVKDKGKLTPYPRAEKIAEKLWNDLFENGVIVYRAVGLAGIDGDAFMIAPPFIIKEDEIDIIVDAIERSFKKIL